MAGSRSVWGIDIGQCALKAIKLTFDAKADRAVAVAFDYIEHPKILSQPDADPDELIRAALEKFAERNPLDGSEVIIGVPGQAGLSRFVKLPPVEPKKIPDIVNFEAKQQIPFDLSDVVWDFQRIGGGGDDEDSVELEVGIFAIRKEAVRKHLEPFSTQGIDVHTVQLAPVALYNYAAFDIVYHAVNAADAPAAEGESAEAPEEEDEGDTIVILDVGADKTDVVITDGDSIWLRNIPFGGNHFTRAITKDLKLSFAKAEHLKRNAIKAQDPKKLYQAMRPVFQDFVGELQRSIGFFASTHRGAVISKIVGMGNGFRLTGLQKFLQQNLQYRVEKVSKFNALTGDDVVGDQTFGDNVMSFTVAYGLALQGLEQTPIQTNLLPTEIRNARLIRDKKPWSLLAAACLLLGFTSVFIGNYFQLKTVAAEAFQGPMQQANGDASRYSGYSSSFDAAKASYATINTSAQRVIGADRLKDRDLWLRAMSLISKAIPPRTSERVRDISKLEEVNIDRIQGTYYPGGFMTWYQGIMNPDNRSQSNAALYKQTMAQVDQQAPPQGGGWVFQIHGYTFNEKVRLFVQDSILPNLQSQQMRDLGVSHAFIESIKTDEDWKPGNTGGAGRSLDFRDLDVGGKAGPKRSDLKLSLRSTGGSSGPNKPRRGEDATADELPEDMQSYMDRSKDVRKESTNTVKRTEFIIEFAWQPDYVPPPAVPSEGVPAGTDPSAIPATTEATP